MLGTVRFHVVAPETVRYAASFVVKGDTQGLVVRFASAGGAAQTVIARLEVSPGNHAAPPI